MSHRRKSRTLVTPTAAPNDGSTLGHLTDAELMKERVRRRLKQGKMDLHAIESFEADVADVFRAHDASLSPVAQWSRPFTTSSLTIFALGLAPRAQRSIDAISAGDPPCCEPPACAPSPAAVGATAPIQPRAQLPLNRAHLSSNRSCTRETSSSQVISAIRKSTRRFFARPAGVALVATGRSSPKPSASSRAGSTPRPMM
jgi:hypothetical protein